MKKRLLCLAMLFTIALAGKATAQNIEVKYQDLVQTEPSELVSTVMDMQLVKACCVTLRGDIEGKKFSVRCHRVVNGEVQEDSFSGFYSGKVKESDSLNIKFYSIVTATDSVKLRIESSAGVFNMPIKIKDSSEAIFMETFLNEKLSIDNPIPIISFNAGETFSTELPNGMKLEGRHYCPIRDEHIHPSKWPEKFKMDEYIYFEVKFD